MMNNTVTLRLPQELGGKLEHEAQRHRMSLAQYILSVLTQTLAYNEASERLQREFQNASDKSWAEITKAIPDRKPLDGDEL